jgi:hypothetical protein
MPLLLIIAYCQSRAIEAEHDACCQKRIPAISDPDLHLFQPGLDATHDGLDQ